jgi:hypothetical protein
VLNSRVLTGPADANRFALYVPPASADVTVENCLFGKTGALTAKDVIRNDGSRLRARNNRTYYSKSSVWETYPFNHNGTTAATNIWSVTWPAGAIEVEQGFDVTVAGDAAGTGGTKTIRIRLGTTTDVVSLTIPAGAVNYSITGRVVVSQGATTWQRSFTGVVGTTVTPFIGTVSHDYTTSTGLHVNAQLANAADTLTTRLVDIRPIDSISADVV